jgi:hypothetical protein
VLSVSFRRFIAEIVKKNKKKRENTFFAAIRVYIMNMDKKELYDKDFKAMPRRWFPLWTLDW